MKQPSAPPLAYAQPGAVQGQAVLGTVVHQHQPMEGVNVVQQPIQGMNVVQPGVVQGGVVQGGYPQAVQGGYPQVVQGGYPQVVQGAVVQGAVVQPQAGAVYTQVQQPQRIRGPPEAWHSGTFDCCADCMSCCIVLCGCGDCLVCLEGEPCGIGEDLGLHSTHVGCGNVCLMWLSSLSFYGFPVCCNMICDCPCGKKWVSWCYYTTVLDTMVDKYNLVYPGPCGDAGIPGGGDGRDCKYQMCCCGPCTLCLIKRELTARKKAGHGAPLAAEIERR